MVKASTKFLYTLQLNLLFISCFIYLVWYYTAFFFFFYYFLEVDFTYKKLYIFKVYNLMCFEIYIYIYEIKISGISITSKSFLVSLCNFSLPLPLSSATTALFSVTVGYCAFSRALCKWNHSVYTLLSASLIRLYCIPWHSTRGVSPSHVHQGDHDLTRYICCTQSKH